MNSKVFSDFSGGWSGNLDLAKVADNMYDARNMIMYQDGSLGPRPGLRAFNLGRTPAGKITGILHTPHPNNTLIYVDGIAVYGIEADNLGLTPTSFGNINAAPAFDLTHSMLSQDDQVAYIFTQATSKRTYKVDLYAGTMANIAEGAITAILYGVRLVRAWGLGLKWSAPFDTSSWPSTNFLTVALKGQEIVFITNQRGHLTIVTRDGQFFVLTGVPGINDTLRRVADPKVSPPALVPHSFVDLGDDLVYYLSPVNNFPVTFDGQEVVEQSYLTMTPEDPRGSYASSGDIFVTWNSVKAFQGADNDEPMFVLTNPTNRLLTKNNGAWGLHQFTVPVGNSWTSDGRGRIFGFGPVQSGAGTPSFTADWRLGRPAFTSDLFARPGDMTDVPFESYVIYPEQWSPTGSYDRVSEVVVDFTRWNTGVPENRIKVTVEALARGTKVPDGIQEKEWTQAAAMSPTTQAGKRDRVRFGFGHQGEGAGWRVKLSGIKGAAIRQVVVNSEPASDNSRVY